jgi:hypothetical protein
MVLEVCHFLSSDSICAIDSKRLINRGKQRLLTKRPFKDINCSSFHGPYAR